MISPAFLISYKNTMIFSSFHIIDKLYRRALARYQNTQGGLINNVAAFSYLYRNGTMITLYGQPSVLKRWKILPIMRYHCQNTDICRSSLLRTNKHVLRFLRVHFRLIEISFLFHNNVHKNSGSIIENKKNI